MSNNKQSSVEWFAKESWKLRVELEDEKISLGEYANKYYQLKQQAKAMHKEEHGQTWDDSLDNLKARGMNEMRAYTDFDDYYNETFNTHENNN